MLFLSNIDLSDTWVFATVATLSGSISALAGLLWHFMQARLAAQDVIIAGSAETIKNLQADVERLTKGCGHPQCHWKHRS